MSWPGPSGNVKLAAMNWSIFGQNLAQGSGIGELMDDLGEALAHGGENILMLGGGQPAGIPEMEACWRQRLTEILAEEGSMERMLGNYDPPVGGGPFRKALANLLQSEFGWPVTEENIAITAGGQTAFFLLFNSLAGRFPDGSRKNILLPLLPEYIGYSNQAVGEDFFTALPALIEKKGPHSFKYAIDFPTLEKTGNSTDFAAICVSRPTNPSGNVLTDEEIEQLRALANRWKIPLIIDNAYGAPFPGILFREVRPVWDENVILTLSLSKIGLPGTRTGIVIARPEIVRALSSMTSIVGLSNGNVGQAIAQPLIENGEILRLSREIIRPFYETKLRQAIDWVNQFFPDHLPWFRHQGEGALFMWMWFPGLPISTRELYQRLKKRKVLVIPGEYFFYGHTPQDSHHRECLRITYTMAPETVREGLRIIAEEVTRAYAEGSAD